MTSSSPIVSPGSGRTLQDEQAAAPECGVRHAEARRISSATTAIADRPMRVNAIVASTRCARGIGSATPATGTS